MTRLIVIIVGVLDDDDDDDDELAVLLDFDSLFLSMLWAFILWASFRGITGDIITTLSDTNKNHSFDRYPLNREGAMKTIVDALSEHDVIVGTTGMLSRELFEYRVAKGQGHEKDFLTVGSMGHASAIALGIAQFRPKRQVGIFFLLKFHRRLSQRSKK